MPMWLRKGLVGLVAVLTFGMIVPTSYIHTETKPSRESIQEPGSDIPPLKVTEELSNTETESRNEEADDDDLSWRDIAGSFYAKDELMPALQSFAMKEAEMQGMQKFGSVISSQIGDAYQSDIVPKFGEAVTAAANKANVDVLRNLEVSRDPASGLGERILHLYDGNTGKELIKFHVRRDHPPLDGYWFNFHYHTHEDGFQSHHELGKIYWDKNTPPHWMA
ncbi:YpjP-like protein [Scopulibacillus darangshiensis]|uniref:YpjP-like protein n=1 Tax=Scopulibacillus darangshiensis TaxID=442528 RepID=A0A4R2NKZ8_9BACL|nr:YpjP family protein [Scopulibacillus darangshiensis]TCP21935.1 YpjP-like protein [Scopulibacillus darangshiensis]